MVQVDLLSAFDREIEVLELTDDYMIYALDQKNEMKDLCSIERMDFSDRQIRRLISLDYTRLWESFRTYGQLPEFFYAVNVLQDYRVRLRRIDKQTWENDTDFLIQPEGEIINIYSLNEDYMVITDEVKADPAVYEKYNLRDEGRRYVNVRYLYEIKSGKKYPITDSHLDSLTEDMPVRKIKGEPVLIYEAFYTDEAGEGSESLSELLTVPVDGFIAHVKSDGQAGFKVLAAAGEDGFDYVRLMSAEDDRIVYRRRNINEQNEQLVALTAQDDGTFEREILCGYNVPDIGEIFYDAKSLGVYHCPDDEDAAQKTVYCLSRPGAALTYDGKYGTFSRLLKDELLVTTYYDEVFVKEYEYHEYAAIHDLKSGQVNAIEGRTEAADHTLVLLRSFLAL